ncbi:unnamed protein product [Rotaria sordida]|uniref:Prefoldin subunit 6 n=1 Tax=Rotaria sordida TaxID=392033 RepID=A0A815Y134_9BILA|nr:unnamed protein product [Rotaria sordida]CAF1294920.1 unnamed protein product [Rotaria sordida]CAF1297778.1 unnamed protein product [Rotaria sordida]CAF1356116.1 unnamed protein product [Rotaria sordida]CAF1564287.1 unnamed protein product [Rotaria sordida]
MAPDLNKKLEDEVEKYRQTQNEMKKFMTQQQQLFITKTENEFVKQEFENLDSDAVIYKLVGPVLVKQELSEGNETVEKRLVYCEGELKRLASLMKDTEKKLEIHREVIAKIQQQIPTNK